MISHLACRFPGFPIALAVALLGVALPPRIAYAVPPCRPGTTAASIDELVPTQMEVGLWSSQRVEENFVRRAGDVAIEDWLITEFNHHPLPGVRGPAGKIHLTDGHHRAVATYRIIRGLPAERAAAARICVEVSEDFSGKPDEFIREMVARGEGYFTPELRQSVRKGVRTWRELYFEVLPKDFGSLPDNPMRSVIGTVFYEAGIDGAAFSDYIEFKVAERLRGQIEAKSGSEGDPELLNAARAAIFENQELLAYLRAEARPGQDGAGMIDRAAAAYRMNQVRLRAARVAKSICPNEKVDSGFDLGASLAELSDRVQSPGSVVRAPAAEPGKAPYVEEIARAVQLNPERAGWSTRARAILVYRSIEDAVRHADPEGLPETQVRSHTKSIIREALDACLAAPRSNAEKKEGVIHESQNRAI